MEVNSATPKESEAQLPEAQEEKLVDFSLPWCAKRLAMIDSLAFERRIEFGTTQELSNDDSEATEVLVAKREMSVSARVRPSLALTEDADADCDRFLSVLFYPPKSLLAVGTRDVVNFLEGFLERHVFGVNSASPKERQCAENILVRVQAQAVSWLVKKLGEGGDAALEGRDDGYGTEEEDGSTCGDDSSDDLVERIAMIIANMSGKGSSGPIRRRFHFPKTHTTLHLNEPTWCSGDVGSMTWGASVAFANLLDTRPSLRAHLLSTSHLTATPTLELGSGTGLGGISLHLLAHVQPLIMSDFNAAVITSAKSNTRLNCAADSVTVVRADWEEIPSSEQPHCAADPVMPHSAPLILACDVLFHPRHPYLVSRAVDRLLSTVPGAEFHLITPRRSRYEGEAEAAREEMAKRGFIVLWDEEVDECGHGSSVLSAAIFGAGEATVKDATTYDDDKTDVVTQKFTYTVFVREQPRANLLI
ncbi:Vacuolar protein-sorting-associated protein 28 [Gonapodya sp. JEL0774]|nr:Vacuolar protein-sorting-associated protein 28 [Gonapodya sp. JEL0774]